MPSNGESRIDRLLREANALATEESGNSRIDRLLLESELARKTIGTPIATPVPAATPGKPSMGNPSLEPGAEGGMDPGLADPIELAQLVLGMAPGKLGALGGSKLGSITTKALTPLLTRAASKVPSKIGKWAIGASVRGGAIAPQFSAINDISKGQNPLPNLPGAIGAGLVGGPALEVLGQGTGKAFTALEKRIGIVVNGIRLPGQLKAERMAREKAIRVQILDDQIKGLIPGGETVTDRITKALEKLPKMLKAQESLHHVHRQGLLEKFNAAGKDLQGFAAMRAKMNTLVGKYPKIELGSVKDLVSNKDMESLLDIAVNSRNIANFERPTAFKGLTKLFGMDPVTGKFNPEGGVLPNDSELKVLQMVYGDKFVGTIMAKRPQMDDITTLGYRIANMPRALRATLDLSAPLRQGLPLLFTNPKEWTSSFGRMLQATFSEEYAVASELELLNRPNAHLYRDADLAITRRYGALSNREEPFIAGDLSEQIPLFGPLARASNRAYSTFLNRLRADVFDAMLLGAEKNGFHPVQKDLTGEVAILNRRVVRDIAKFVNTASGRGETFTNITWLKKGGNPSMLSTHAALLNMWFFSPRFMASRVSMLNPLYYIQLSGPARSAALRAALGTGMSVLTAGYLAKRFAGLDVTMDIEDPDYFKVKIGNTRLDPSGGFLPYIRFGSALARGLIDGEGQAGQATIRMARTKLAPIPAVLTDYLFGSDVVGNENTPVSTVQKLAAPMILQDAYDLAKEHSPATAAFLLANGFFGHSIQTYK